jgi:hypothetical protein
MKRIERMSPNPIGPYDLGELPPEPPAPARGESMPRMGGGHPSHAGHHAKKRPEGDGERQHGGHGGYRQGGRPSGGRSSQGGGYRGRRW